MKRAQMETAYNLFIEQQSDRGINVKELSLKLKEHQIELPSWGFVDSGTRFGVFHQPGAARGLSPGR